MEEDRYLKKQRIYRTIMLIILTAFFTFMVTSITIVNKCDFGKGNETISSLLKPSNDSLTNTIDYIESILDKYYLNEIDEEKALEGAVKGYIDSLGDPYTQYIPKDEMKAYTEQLIGNYVGIGIYMVENTEKNTIEVVAPIKDSPAEEVGLLPGDTILSVNGIKYTGADMDAAANSIKGEEGTVVKLEILRKQERKTFEITRRKVSTNPVIAEKLENNIGYIEISSFDEETSNQFKTKYEKLKNEGIASLIIDLRNNGGGLLEEALQIADYIVPKGKDLLITVDKKQKEEVRKSEEDPIIDMPIVVLVNEYSASASEILAGALKDLGEATIVGNTTYGKGVIQQLLSLKDGSGLKVTVEEYYTPNRTKINGIGIEPHEKVELPKSIENALILEYKDDTQLQKAIEILKGE